MVLYGFIWIYIYIYMDLYMDLYMVISNGHVWFYMDLYRTVAPFSDPEIPIDIRMM